MKLETKDFHDSVAKFWSTYFVSSYSYNQTDWLFFVYLVNILEVMRSAVLPSSTFLKLCPQLVGRESLNIWLQGNIDNTDLSSIVQHCSAFLLEEIKQLNLGYTQSMQDFLTQQIRTTTYHKSKRDYQ
jgi:hypothetical protein